jgi:phosphatidylinositol glycan class B
MRLGSRFIKLVAFVLVATISKVAGADLNVYTDGGLLAGWENWSWSSTIDFAATDIFSGSSGSSISVASDAWAAFSLYYDQGSFKTFAGLQFDVSVSHR